MELLAIGRVKRRFFRVGGATQSRTELVADRVLPMAPEEDVRTVLADAASKISAVIADIELRPQ